MKNMWKDIARFFLSLLLVFGTGQIFAQDELEEESECARILRQAQKAYDDGLIEKVDQMLKPCLQSGQLSKDEQLDGYRLLALSKLYDGKDQEAEEAMLEFLRIDPEYELQPGVDPKEFSELYDNYHTSPLYTVGIFGGLNWARPQSYKEYGSYNLVDDKKAYSSNFGFQVGIRGTRYIYRGLNVHLDLAFMTSQFTYTHDILESYTQVDNNAGDPPGSSVRGATKGVTVESVESQNAFVIPLSFSYTFMLQKQIRPYVMAGFETRMLIAASNSITKTYFDQDIAAVELSEIDDFKSHRNGTTFSALFGVGAKYKITRGDLFFELKYNMGISDQVSRDAVDVNDDQTLWNFYEQDNDFTLDNMMFNIGYNLYLYKPRKMKQPKKVKEAKEPKAPKEKKVKEPKEAKEKESEKKHKSDTKDSGGQRRVIE